MDAKTTSSHSQILAEKQEAVTHLVSLTIQHGALVLPESVWLWEGVKGTSRARSEGTEEPKSGSAWWCKARG